MRRSRLFLETKLLEANTKITLTLFQANYLINALRMSVGDPIWVFNGYHGEWCACVDSIDRRVCTLRLIKKEREQIPISGVHYFFAPFRSGRLYYTIQKAVELGAVSFNPVITQHTIVREFNKIRIVRSAIEAAEQCGLLFVPKVSDPVSLSQLIDRWPIWEACHFLIFCDELFNDTDFLSSVRGLSKGSVAVLVGPEGGFSAQERFSLLSKDFVVPVSLGPRILKSDTAAMAVLACLQLALVNEQDKK